MAYWFHPKAQHNLVLLHGFVGTVQMWAEVASHLPPTLGVVALPLPGHDPQTPAEPTFEATCEALAHTIRRLQGPQVHLVGYSLGARLGIGLALRHPELMTRVSLIGGHVGLETEQARTTRQQEDAVWIDMLRHEGIESFVAAWETLPIFASQAALAPQLRAAQRRQRLSHDAQGLAASLASTGLGVMPNLWPKLKDNTVPMDLIVGARDEKFVRLLNRVKRATPQAQLYSMAGCGHNVPLEVPAELAALLHAEHAHVE